MSLEIRKALQDEIEWINTKYDEIGFIHSQFDNEVIAVAVLHNDDEAIRVGIGRLVTIDDKTLELGGIYVFDRYQGQGIAGKLVKFLLTHPETNQLTPFLSSGCWRIDSSPYVPKCRGGAT